MDFFVASTVILGIWAALGPLAGVRYGHELSERSQRKHWFRDNEKAEYREVLAAMTTAFAVIMPYYTPMVVHGPDEMRQRDEVERVSIETMRNRLFIAQALNDGRIPDRWIAALRTFDNKHDVSVFRQQFQELEAEIRELAQKSLAH